MRDAPQHNGGDGNPADEPLHPGKFILHRADGDDGGVFPGLEGSEKEKPDEEDGKNADGNGDEEPAAPARFGPHVLYGDYILWRGNGRSGAADVGGEGYAEDECFGEFRVRREIAE